MVMLRRYGAAQHLSNILIRLMNFTMRKPGSTTRPLLLSTSLRHLRLATGAMALGACLITGAARAEDAADADELKDRVLRAFSIDKIGEMTGLRKSDEQKGGIEYRERSPLVVPKSRDLPPPEAAAAGPKATNWPHDPGVVTAGRKAKPTTTVATQQPGTSDLPDSRGGGPGIDWGAFTAPWSKKKAETVQFTGEPTRESLTQPPPGYQTPSPDYAYGNNTGPEAVKFDNPVQQSSDHKQ